ncbi:MAG: putative porin, partial [Rhodanobacteraceae bacterium]
RYEVRNGETAAPDPINPPGDTFQRNRARYRLRIGLKGTLIDDWFFGLRLETSTNPRSTNVTFGDDTAAGPGPFAKNSDGISVGQAYFGYKGFPGLKLTAGKMPNPFVTSSMVWDGDINPEGLAEQYTYTINLGGGSPASSQTVTDKDGKTMVQTTPAVSGPTLDLFVNFGQFVYDDTNPDNPVGPAPNGVSLTDAYLLGWQVGARYNIKKGTFFQIAPTLYNYTGTGDTFNRAFSGDPTFVLVDPVTGARTTVTPNQTGINNLLVLEVPAEFDGKFGSIPYKFFGDFAYNFNGDARARAAGHPDKTDQNFAYQIGAGIGGTKHKGDFGLTAFWQHTEQY